MLDRFREDGAMKQIFGLGLAAAVAALATVTADAQDFTAGKTPAQLFGTDCSACHHSPAGLAKGRDGRTLATFLREHYTTKSESAGALGAYVATFSGAFPPPEARRGRRDAEAAGVEEGRPAGRGGEEAQPRRRRTVNQSGDGEKPRARENGEPAGRDRCGAGPASRRGRARDAHRAWPRLGWTCFAWARRGA
jgi:mono/diheme cytochrome c family protein